MILITGAGGKTGKAISKALLAKLKSSGSNEKVRAMVHHPDQKKVMKDLGVAEVVTGDLRDQQAMNEATKGIRAVYHICPNVNPNEETIGQLAIMAARKAHVEQFVYHSVLHPGVESMPHHWLKFKVEEKLLESGLNFTILQPAAYMQNVLAQLSQIKERGIYPVPYAAETRLGMVDLEDVAKAAATVLTESTHLGAIYELAGSDILTQAEVAAAWSKQLGRKVEVEVIPLEAWEQRARASGMEAYAIEILLKMFRYYEQFGFWGNANVLGWLLGHPPTSFEAFIAREIRGSQSK
jgi:uncharacterized protein YbjT (DUF2867 family)